MRVALIAAAPSATAFTTRWRSTRSATSAWRVGRSAASVAPKTIATRRIATKLAWLVATSTASDPALRPSTDCVTSRMRRLGQTVGEDTAGQREDDRWDAVGSRNRRNRRGAPGPLVHEITERDDLHPGAEQRRPLRGPVPAEGPHPQCRGRPSALAGRDRLRRRSHRDRDVHARRRLTEPRVAVRTVGARRRLEKDDGETRVERLPDERCDHRGGDSSAPV